MTPPKTTPSRAQKPTPSGSQKPPSGRPSPLALGILLWWHGLLGGSFFVAMATGYGAYYAHAFAGVVTILAIVLRLAVGAAFPKGHILSFPWPRFAALGQGGNGVRRFLSHVMGLALLVVCGLAVLTGWFAWRAQDAHSYFAYLAFTLVVGHLGLVIVFQGWKHAEAFVRSRT